ncbi:hypothetical protein IEQ34_016419 [Dendrobium chrysotoxum]|uniref:Uncharacterized protein n=1 Tax=Dendrobium chrysotoxum TaxID=161865 RepID=A0AAV7GE30_DENCH|nr:hypothetical protein IEQ34_016419 [Dendrobium chrysotoxum]
MSSPAYEGGSGGYVKRRLFKNSARTPYERPPSAACGVRSTTTVKGNGGRWLPTFMEPVSRFITRTGYRLLSSVLPKRLSAQSGVEEKHLVKLDTPVLILAEQKLVDCHSLITSKSGGISDIEQFISQRWAEAKHFMASINSRSSELLKSESANNKQVKVLKRDISFLDDDNVLLGPLCKIPKKSIIEEDKAVVNVPFTMAISGDQIVNNEMNDASTSSHMTFSPQRKSFFHISAPEDVDLEEDVVENAPCTIAISGGAISCHNTLPSQRKSYFHMSAPEDIDDSDEEYDVTEESDQSLFNLGTTMNDGSTGTCGSSNVEDFTFPIIIDLDSPSHVKLPFQKD